MVRLIALTLATSAALAGCAGEAQNDAAPVNAANATNDAGAMAAGDAANSAAVANAAPAALPTDSWIGRWTGPEGLFLDIARAPGGDAGRYAIVNKDRLDRQADYSGVADGATIRFVRDGEDITLRPGKGADTGFKWLADKTDCLIAVPGQEGYCR